jgi:uncharacterized protein YcbX
LRGATQTKVFWFFFSKKEHVFLHLSDQKATVTAHLTEIRVFPVKGLRGDTQDSAVAEPRGLEGDRRWMVVDTNGRFLSQRELPRMALLSARIEVGGIRLATAGQAPLFVPVPTQRDAQAVRVWDDTVAALPAGPPASAWLTEALGAACALVFQADAASRPVRPTHAVAGDVVSFADAFPILLGAAESLADLNARLARPVPMLRFRPNLVVEGAPAWAEDGWRRVRIGNAIFRVVKACDRCIVTTIDPDTGDRPDPEEPLRTLKSFRRDARGRVYFGQNLVPERCGLVRVGDAVEVLEAGAPNVAVDLGRKKTLLF